MLFLTNDRCVIRTKKSILKSYHLTRSLIGSTILLYTYTCWRTTGFRSIRRGKTKIVDERAHLRTKKTIVSQHPMVGISYSATLSQYLPRTYVEFVDLDIGYTHRTLCWDDIWRLAERVIAGDQACAHLPSASVEENCFVRLRFDVWCRDSLRSVCSERWKV